MKDRMKRIRVQWRTNEDEVFSRKRPKPIVSNIDRK